MSHLQAQQMKDNTNLELPTKKKELENVFKWEIKTISCRIEVGYWCRQLLMYPLQLNLCMLLPKEEKKPVGHSIVSDSEV